MGRFRRLLHHRAELFAGVFVVLSFVWLQAELGGPTATTWFDDLAETLAALVAAAMCGFAAVRLSGRERVSWALIAAAAACWGLGELVWNWYELGLRVQVPFPSLADAGYLGSVPLLVAGLLCFPRVLQGALPRLLAVIDGLTIGAALLAASWAAVLGAVFAAGGDSLFTKALSLAYPLGDVIVGTMALLMATRARTGTRTPLLLLAGGLWCTAIADTGFAYFNAAGTYGNGNGIDTGWIAGFLLVALAGRRAARQRGIAASRTPLPSRLGVLVPYLPVLLAVVVVIVRHGSLDQAGPFIAALVFVQVVLLIVRQMIAMLESAGVTHSLAHDSLTGLPTRAMLRMRTEAAFDARPPRERAMALMMVELDDFTEVTDRWGLGGGDRVVATIGQRLRECVRGEDMVGRVWGSRFGVLLDDPATTEDAVAVARRLVAAVEAPIRMGEDSISVRATIGLASAARGAVDSAELHRQADVALATSTRERDGDIVVYEPRMEEVIDEQVRWRAELDGALRADQLVVHYQPIVNVGTRRVAGVEALLRWDHPRFGLVPPLRFIPEMERTGLIIEVGAWVLREACRQVQRWREELEEPLFLTVNVSSVQVHHDGFDLTVRDALRQSGLPGPALTLELTESGLIDRAESTLSRLRHLRSQGVNLALDDFGTGYSSLTYLERFHIDMLKIDKSFLDRAPSHGERSLINALLGLGEALGLTTLVEGVEDETQHALLCQLGCNLAQGYLYARPAAAADLRGVIGGAVPRLRVMQSA
jgi:diguanylate cyclase